MEIVLSKLLLLVDGLVIVVPRLAWRPCLPRNGVRVEDIATPDVGDPVTLDKLPEECRELDDCDAPNVPAGAFSDGVWGRDWL